MNVQGLVLVLIVGIVCYQVYVTARVLRVPDYTRAQKISQSVIIWFVPFLGAGLCHLVLYTTTDRTRPSHARVLEGDDDDIDRFGGRLGGRSGARPHSREPSEGAEVSDVDGD